MKLDQSESSLSLMKIHKARTETLEAEDEPKQQAFEKCFEQYWALVYRILAGMLGDPDEAEDVALEAFYRLYQRHPVPEREFNTGGWLVRVATNLGLHSIRSFKRRQAYEQAAGKIRLEDGPEGGPAEIHEAEEERRTARTALGRLNPRQSRLLVMRYSGMTYKEIAAALNLSPTSIGPLLLRAEREFEKQYRRLVQEAG
ncbi:MAG TPA: sigma-70 family RNA polymerase sigma factor [Anaerolineales bacterium]|nr:sigma-70 family RNA polymerase sigma factor [Anaerolineales bacterium]